MTSWWAKLRSFVGSDRLNVNVRFELLREAISGTMSEFYLARERATDRIVGPVAGPSGNHLPAGRRDAGIGA